MKCCFVSLARFDRLDGALGAPFLATADIVTVCVLTVIPWPMSTITAEPYVIWVSYKWHPHNVQG